MLLIFHILAFVAISRRPKKCSISMHFVLEPVTFVLSSIFEFHNSFSVSFSALHLSSIGITIEVEELSVT